MKRVFGILTLVVVVVTVFAACSKREEGTLYIHVGGTMTPVMKAVSKAFEEETGVKVDVSSAGSGVLLANIELKKEGDVYICHDPFLDVLMKKKLGSDGWVISQLKPVIVVQKGNPEKIKGLKDLEREDLEVWLTDYNYSTLGRMLPKIFEKAGISFRDFDKKKSEAMKLFTNRSGGFVANRVATGNADAALCWQVVAHLRKDDVDIIEIPDKHLPVPYVDALSSATGKSYILSPVRVTLAVLNCSKQKELAQKFAEFTVSEKAAKIFKAHGYNVDGIKKLYEDGKKIK